MNAPSDRALQKVTMNFYRDDIEALAAKFGNGWSTEIRMIISDFVRKNIHFTQLQELPDE